MNDATPAPDGLRNACTREAVSALLRAGVRLEATDDGIWRRVLACTDSVCVRGNWGLRRIPLESVTGWRRG